MPEGVRLCQRELYAEGGFYGGEEGKQGEHLWESRKHVRVSRYQVQDFQSKSFNPSRFNPIQVLVSIQVGPNLKSERLKNVRVRSKDDKAK